jgi:hypothetical protein
MRISGAAFNPGQIFAAATAMRSAGLPAISTKSVHNFVHKGALHAPHGDEIKDLPDLHKKTAEPAASCLCTVFPMAIVKFL